MPSGNVPAGGCCPQCGTPVGQQGFGGAMMPGTYAPGMGAGGPSPWMGFGGPGMGYGFGMMPGYLMNPWNWGWMSPTALGWGLGGLRRWGGTYSPQFTMTGLPTDNEIVEMVYDAIDADPLIPFDADINVESDAGTVTLTGTVATKEIKHAVGDDTWWIPGVDDVRNDLQVERRRPAMAERREQAAMGRQPPRPTGVARMRR